MAHGLEGQHKQQCPATRAQEEPRDGVLGDGCGSTQGKGGPDEITPQCAELEEERSTEAPCRSPPQAFRDHDPRSEAVRKPNCECGQQHHHHGDPPAHVSGGQVGVVKM
jgi:hypothetical protein